MQIWTSDNKLIAIVLTKISYMENHPTQDSLLVHMDGGFTIDLTGNVRMEFIREVVPSLLKETHNVC